jgi:hypothetical protein
MSAPQPAGAWFPPPSAFRWSWSIPDEILEPLLRRRDDAATGAPQAGHVPSADEADAELPAG